MGENEHYSIITIKTFIEYIEHYRWTQIRFTPEVPDNDCLLKDFFPSKGWSRLYYKNFVEKTRGICFYNPTIKDGYMNDEIFFKYNTILNKFKLFFKDYYDMECDESTKVVVNNLSINHNLALSGII